MVVKVNIDNTELRNIHIALGIGIIYGMGILSGWILTLWNVL